ncbi:protocatechuate 3,4-dioxygenase subunit beta [Denitrobaculum tricleocarpae]|uniref:Protocatechuate 3,4-dioxygenase subunit beta n=2 Tax=Denitrobaculum tricleocarpae TaxID=2591009 RepID=A0A545U3A2_9PROT|nr:protocatechuate 3,4-dioxygenase subunit beta [Denitrobaculum tricleocarpae]
MTHDADYNSQETQGPFIARDPNWQPKAYTADYKYTIARAPKLPALSVANTVSEMTGPVFSKEILGKQDNDLIHNYARSGEAATGEPIIVHGKVVDEHKRPMKGVLVEFWQTNASGRYRHKTHNIAVPLDPNFGGFGRFITDNEGHYWFRTIRPGGYPWPNGPNAWRPPHIHFSVFGYAFAQRLISQMYFSGDPLVWQCPIVRSISDTDAIETLLAKPDIENSAPMDALAYRFDVVLRGRRMTFFENHE